MVAWLVFWCCYWFRLWFVGGRVDYSMTRARTAWTIFKLKCIRVVLRPLIKTHVWFVLRGQKKVKDETINTGTARPDKAKEDT